MRIADRLERLAGEDVRVLHEKSRQRGGDGGDDPEVAFPERAAEPVAVEVHHPRIRLRSGDRPGVVCDLAPHAAGKIRATLEAERQDRRAEIAPSSLGMLRDAQETLESRQRLEEQEANVLAEGTDNREAPPLDPERGYVDPQHLLVIGFPPRCHRPEPFGGGEQVGDGFRCNRTVLEIAHVCFVGREGFGHRLDDLVDLRSGGEYDLDAEIRSS
jgi:hypothetical protein